MSGSPDAGGLEYGAPLRVLWALEADTAHLNHGAFGATPVELFAQQDNWRRQLEANPARFFMSELPAHLRSAAADLAGFVGTEPDRLAFVENASSGIAAVLRSLEFGAGDRIVTTSHVYNAVRNMLRLVAETSGTEIVEAPVPMPVTSRPRSRRRSMNGHGWWSSTTSRRPRRSSCR